ncbi:MAG TPA: hypothetical protein VIX82_17610 [Solirubrobacteraceae bacterium]
MPAHARQPLRAGSLEANLEEEVAIRQDKEIANDPDDEIVMFLERDQLVSDKALPVPRAHLSARARAALWALRAFVLIVSAMVIYTFFSQLAH